MAEKELVYCPVCQSRRATPVLHVPYVGIFFLSLLVALFLGTGAGLFFSPITGGWVAFVLGMLSFLSLEVYYTRKFRRELVCPVCEFDPILFRKAPEKAKDRCLQSAEQKPLEIRKQWAAFEQRHSGMSPEPNRV